MNTNVLEPLEEAHHDATCKKMVVPPIVSVEVGVTLAYVLDETAKNVCSPGETTGTVP